MPAQIAGSSWSRDLELLVAEVGNELEGAAERGDEAVQDVLSGDVAALGPRLEAGMPAPTRRLVSRMACAVCEAQIGQP